MCEARTSGVEVLKPVDVSGLCLRKAPVQAFVFMEGADTLRYKTAEAAGSTAASFGRAS
jgi:hypothetical protein